MSELKR